jgi:hypothetical protein
VCECGWVLVGKKGGNKSMFQMKNEKRRLLKRKIRRGGDKHFAMVTAEGTNQYISIC